ncbi:PLC-like phosphodiesterase [Atractiella rhizophila]|nr:PLC-like phosphodiesterase [Atractiella rhizophila]
MSKNQVPALESMPVCWGHRGASAAFPENTLKSFEMAIKDGAEGIESDVHITSDGIIVMHHDTHLDRTTNGHGLIFTQPYHGTNGVSTLSTRKEPKQSIPTFAETLELLLAPGNEKIELNIDVKVDNDPEKLFSLMHDIISAHPSFQSTLAPRLILGLWHPKYLEPAKRLVPYLRRIHIGVSPALARKYFWKDCEGFSINFAALVAGDGEKFRKECRENGKDVYVWTVNKRNEMIEATKWGVKAILTDRTADLLKLRKEMTSEWHAVSKENGPLFSWSSIWYNSLVNGIVAAWEEYLLTKSAGGFGPIIQTTKS